LYAEEDARITEWLRAVFGVRVDRFDVAVKDHLEQQVVGAPATSGNTGATLASPKMSWVFSPLEIEDVHPKWLESFDLFFNFGRGFHSNDARGALLPGPQRVTLLTKATGWEVGLRTNIARSLDLAATVFRLDLDNETVWNGDEGTTETVGPTRRQGIELEARAKIWKWLFFDADATFTKATYRENAGNGNAVALAPTRTFAGGVGVKHPDGWFGSLRVRSIADRPANESGTLTAQGWTLLDAMAGYRWKSLEFAVDVRNLLGTEWKEVQFANTSKLKTEAAPVEDIHFTPGWPRTVIGRVSAYF
jgi:outer membrane receptor protein involved in Fe transport